MPHRGVPLQRLHEGLRVVALEPRRAEVQVRERAVVLRGAGVGTAGEGRRLAKHLERPECPKHSSERPSVLRPHQSARQNVPKCRIMIHDLIAPSRQDAYAEAVDYLAQTNPRRERGGGEEMPVASGATLWHRRCTASLSSVSLHMQSSGRRKVRAPGSWRRSWPRPFRSGGCPAA